MKKKILIFYLNISLTIPRFWRNFRQSSFCKTNQTEPVLLCPTHAHIAYVTFVSSVCFLFKQYPALFMRAKYWCYQIGYLRLLSYSSAAGFVGCYYSIQPQRFAVTCTKTADIFSATILGIVLIRWLQTVLKTFSTSFCLIVIL